MSSYESIKRRKKEARVELLGTREQMMRVLRANAGAGTYRNRDLVYALSESFSQVFDFMGGQRVQEMAGQKR